MNIQTNFRKKTFRDPAYLKRIANQKLRCAITGQYGDENNHIVPAHIGTAGKGLKSPDNEVIPMRSDLHQLSHQMGDVSFWCQAFKENPHVLRSALRAWGRELHAKEMSNE